MPYDATPRPRSRGATPRPGSRGARYVAEKALVPREVCETPTLAQKLADDGYALRPLTHSRASQERRDYLREEIERLQVERAADQTPDGLWDGEGFVFVAEAKARTLQLRNRTLELLSKEASFEPPPKVQPSLQDAVEELASDREQGAQARQVHLGDAQDSGESVQECQRDPEEKEALRTLKVWQDSLRPPPTTDAGKSSFTVMGSEGRRTLSKDRICNALRASKQFNALLHDSPNKLDGSEALRTEPPNKNMGNINAKKIRSSIVKTRAVAPKVDSRRVGRTSTASSLYPVPMVTKKKQPEKVETGKAGPALSLAEWMEKQILFHDIRQVSIEGGETPDSVLATVRVMENKSTGGVRLEVLTSKKPPLPALTIERSLPLDEVTALFDWGNSHREAVETRYKWVSDIVKLRIVEDTTEERNRERDNEKEPEKHGKRLIIVLGDFDIKRDKVNKQFQGMEFISTGLKSLFGESRHFLKQELDFNIRIAYNDPDLAERRKDVEVESARKRYNLYENTARALHEWYCRLDRSGDGQMDIEEFGTFIRGVVCGSFGHTIDDTQVLRHWREMRATADGIGFTQFINYLFHKFPHVRQMTAFQVKQFEARSKKAAEDAADAENQSFRAAATKGAAAAKGGNHLQRSAAPRASAQSVMSSLKLEDFNFDSVALI